MPYFIYLQIGSIIVMHGLQGPQKEYKWNNMTCKKILTKLMNFDE